MHFYWITVNATKRNTFFSPTRCQSNSCFPFRTEHAEASLFRTNVRKIILDWRTVRAVASLTVPGGQEFHFPHFFPKFRSILLIFPQTFFIFFLILVLRVGESPTREGPGYATAHCTLRYKKCVVELAPCRTRDVSSNWPWWLTYLYILRPTCSELNVVS